MFQQYTMFGPRRRMPARAAELDCDLPFSMLICPRPPTPGQWSHVVECFPCALAARRVTRHHEQGVELQMTLTATDWDRVEAHVGALAHRTERAELRALPAMLEGVRHFVDVGASFGPFTWVAHYSLRDAQMTAIEANPLLCRHLETEALKIVTDEDDRGNRILVRNNAVSNHVGDTTFLINASDYSTSHISANSGNEALEQHMQPVTVRACTLDSLFGDAPPDLIKLDVEGFEWRAVDGARRILAASKTRFLVEIHPWGDPEIGKTPRHVFELFRQNGYGVQRVNHHWLFIPGRDGLIMRMQSRFYAFCLERPWIRSLARHVLSMGR